MRGESVLKLGGVLPIRGRQIELLGGALQRERSRQEGVTQGGSGREGKRKEKVYNEWPKDSLAI